MSLTHIQQIEREKRIYHAQNWEKQYLNGCFSLQIRYGAYGFGKRGNSPRHIQIRWGTKKVRDQGTFTPAYWTKSFAVKDDLTIEPIDNSFKYTYNYNTLEKLLKKCEKEQVPKEMINKYITTLKKHNIITKQN